MITLSYLLDKHRRVIDTTTPGGKPVAASLASTDDSLDTLYALKTKGSYHIIPSVFIQSGFYSRRLSLSELFALWNLTVSLFQSSFRQQC